MTSMLTAFDVMTDNPVTVTEASAIESAIRIMLDRHISGLPVIDQSGSLVGIVTEGDLLRRAELGTETNRSGWLNFLRGPSRQAEEYVHTNSRVVGDLMTWPVITAESSAPLNEIVTTMRDKGIKRIPVLDHGRLVGVVSRSDLLRRLADALTEAAGEGERPFRDADVERAVAEKLHSLPWTPESGITVNVLDGVADINGVLFVEADRAALRVMVQNVSGVRSIRDNLIWVEPNSGMTYPPA